MISASNDYETALPSLPESGIPQATRITSPEQVRNLVQSWLQSDREGRSQKRALVDGLVQGNPPYSRRALVKEGRGDATNVNWRTAEAYEDSAGGAIYDIFSEAPTYATIELDAAAEFDGQEPDKTVEWSGIVTEEFHYLMRSDRSWDSVMQNSIRETVRFGAGPLFFRDTVDWRNCNVLFSNLLVPEDASSDVNKWEACAVLDDALAHQLYELIHDSDAASAFASASLFCLMMSAAAIASARVMSWTVLAVARAWSPSSLRDLRLACAPALASSMRPFRSTPANPTTSAGSCPCATAKASLPASICLRCCSCAACWRCLKPCSTCCRSLSVALASCLNCCSKR